MSPTRAKCRLPLGSVSLRPRVLRKGTSTQSTLVVFLVRLLLRLVFVDSGYWSRIRDLRNVIVSIRFLLKLFLGLIF